MRTRSQRDGIAEELIIAIGLVWGHLSAEQFEDAYRLARGCLRIWPDSKQLIMMAAYAAAEVLEPVDTAALLALKDADSADWIAMVLRRAEMPAAARQQPQ